MQLDERGGDGQAEPGALHAVGEGHVGLLERTAEARQVGGRDARSGVLDINVDLVVEGLRADANLAAVGRELHGVAQQRDQNALDRAWIGVEISVGLTSISIANLFSRAVSATDGRNCGSPSQPRDWIG